MNDSTEYIGNFAAGYADDYDSMMGGMNFSVATDDVHVSTVSTSTMGGSDDVAAHDVHVSTVSTSTLGGSDDVNLHNDNDGLTWTTLIGYSTLTCQPQIIWL